MATRIRKGHNLWKTRDCEDCFPPFKISLVKCAHVRSMRTCTTEQSSGLALALKTLFPSRWRRACAHRAPASDPRCPSRRHRCCCCWCCCGCWCCCLGHLSSHGGSKTPHGLFLHTKLCNHLPLSLLHTLSLTHSRTHYTHACTHTYTFRMCKIGNSNSNSNNNGTHAQKAGHYSYIRFGWEKSATYFKRKDCPGWDSTIYVSDRFLLFVPFSYLWIPSNMSSLKYYFKTKT